MKKLFLLIPILVMSMFLGGCTFVNDADVARYNLEKDEQNFEVFRRVVFYNGITGEYILQIEGKIAIIVDSDGDIVVTVKTDDGKYLKHYLGLSDNVTYFSEQLQSNAVSDKNYKVIFKPSTIIPDIEIK